MLATIQTIFISVLTFALIVIIHEFGHFIVAKLCKIQVDEFSVGFGPALVKKQFGQTMYAVRVIPLGGYVAMLGEDEASDNPRAFNNAKRYKRFLVMVAGATMNILLGFVILLVLTAATPGAISSTTVAQFSENARSEQTGLQVNDQIIGINGKKVNIDQDILFEISSITTDTVDFTVLRNGEKVELNDVQFDTIEYEGQRIITLDFKVYPIQKTFGSVLRQSYYWTISVGKMIWQTLVKLVTGQLGINQLSGPVGVATAIGQASSAGARSFFILMAFITINIGIFNLLPIPALDGGKILFLLIEAIRRKPIKPEHEGYITMAGFALLILLLVFVSYHDIVRLITG